MKTLYAPDSLSALSAAIHDAAASEPLAVLFVVVVVACAMFARFAARQF